MRSLEYSGVQGGLSLVGAPTVPGGGCQMELVKYGGGNNLDDYQAK